MFRLRQATARDDNNPVRFRLRLAAFITTLVVVLAWSAAEAHAEGPAFEPGVVLVRWGPGVRAQEAVLTALEARMVDSIPQLGVTRLRVPPGSEETAAAALRRAGAELAEPSYLRRATATPDDPLYSQQWAWPKINAPGAWDITTGSSSIMVAVVDTGVDLAHPDRPQNLVAGADFSVDPSGNTLLTGDPQGHGTHVSGIVAARMNNGAGVAGVAPGSTLLGVRVLDAKGWGNTSITALGIRYAADRGARVISLSLAGTGESSLELEAINYAYGKGALVVAAAGNCYVAPNDCDNQVNPIMYPAASQHVLAVAATDINDAHAYYSETGSYVDLAAPGNSILSTCANGASSWPYPPGYCLKTGTSMATPLVAGVAALVWSLNPNLNPDQVEAILRQGAVDLGTPGRDDTFGYGRVDAYQSALQAQATLGYAAQFVGQSFPLTMTIGQQVTASVQLKNAGGTTWQRGGANPLRLGTSQPQERSSLLYTPGNWLSPSRPAALDQTSVAPGQTGSFTFRLTGPATGGTFTEYFQAVAEGQTWLEQPVVRFKVHILLPPQPNKTYLPFVGRQASGW